MTASAKLMLNGFQPFYGLDRKFVTEFWHVAGVTAGDAGWTSSNTEEKVIAVVPRVRGIAHPDPGLKGAICTGLRLVDGPWPQADGTYEGIVQATFDTDRRWGSAFRESGAAFGKEIEGWGVETFVRGFQLPTTSSTAAYNWNYVKIPFKRSAIFRSFVCDATNISEQEKSQIFQYCGSLFSVFGFPYIYRSPVIVKLRTNQTLVTYNFESSSAVPAFAANAITGMTIIATPELGPLEEYVLNVDSNPPSVGKRLSTVYTGDIGDPTLLPFWGARL